MSAGEPVLRPAVPADAPALVAVWRRAVLATHDFLAPGDVDRYEGVVRAGLPQLTVTVAERQGRVRGFVAVDGDRVEMLFVDPDAARQGVARALLEWAVATATADGATELTTHASITARPFFEAHGFVVVAEQHPVRRGVTLTNYRMRRPL